MTISIKILVSFAILILGIFTIITRTHDAPDDNLTISITSGEDTSNAIVYTLTCHPKIGGNHPNAQNACNILDEITIHGIDPFAPVPEGTGCTMIFGGMETATVVGSWNGKDVNAKFNKRDGCQIERWNKIGPLLQTSSSSSQ